MKSLAAILTCLAGAALLFPITLGASETVGIYALIERVVLEPDQTSPQRIQLWGAFSNNRDAKNPKRGYMYFTLPVSQQETARKEWTDFKTIAGTGRVVAFGMQRFGSAQGREPADAYFATLARVRPATETPRSPDIYPLNFGIQEMHMNMIAIVDPLKASLKK